MGLRPIGVPPNPGAADEASVYVEASGSAFGRSWRRSVRPDERKRRGALVSQVTSVPLLRPTPRASAGVVPIVDSGSALDMDVRPTAATDQEVTFQITFLNQAPAPAL